MKMQRTRPVKGELVGMKKIEVGENGYNPNQSYQQVQAYNAIQSTSNNQSNRMVAKTQFPKYQRKTQLFLDERNNKIDDSETYQLSHTSLPNQTSFNKKQKVAETYSASDLKQTNPAINIKSSNNSIDRINSHMNSYQGFPTQILEFLQKGDMTKFLTLYEKINSSHRTKIKDLKNYFVTQQNFYKKLKLIISDGYDSNAYYSDQSFNFFEDIPQIFNKILVELSRKLQAFESFKDAKKKYLSSNSLAKIEDNFEKFMKAIHLLKADKEKWVNDMKATKNELSRKNNEITDLKEKVQDLQLKLKMQQHSKGQSLQLTQLKRKLDESEHNEWRLNCQLRQLQTKYQYQTNELELYTKKFQESNDDNNKLKYDVKELVAKIQRSDENINSLQNENKNLQFLLQQMQTTKIQSSKSNSMSDNKQFQDLKMQLQAKTIEIFDYKSRIKQLRINQEDYRRAISQLEDKINQQSVSKKEDLSKYYLESSWLLQHKDATEKSRLINMIKNYCGRQTSQFKLLYKYQKFQQSNFHDYIDNNSNFLILIRLINNNVIGGFCPYPLAKNQKPNAGFLFNLTSNSFYPLKEGKACYIYDDFYLSMGNSQIRIRMSDNFVYSSFGIQNEHFQSKNHTIGNFFCGYDFKNTQREMQFIGYEVYEVKLV